MREWVVCRKINREGPFFEADPVEVIMVPEGLDKAFQEHLKDADMAAYSRADYEKYFYGPNILAGLPVSEFM